MEQWRAQPDWNEPDARDCSFLAARIITGGGAANIPCAYGHRAGGKNKIYLLIPLPFYEQ